MMNIELKVAVNKVKELKSTIEWMETQLEADEQEICFSVKCELWKLANRGMRNSLLSAMSIVLGYPQAWANC